MRINQKMTNESKEKLRNTIRKNEELKKLEKERIKQLSEEERNKIKKEFELSQQNKLPTGYKLIPGFSRYGINQNGSIWNISRGKEVATALNHNKYVVATLIGDDDYRRPLRVHRLVYITYIGELLSADQVDHIDNNRRNNHVSNLQLMSGSENVKKMRETGFGKNNWPDDLTHLICAEIDKGYDNRQIISNLKLNSDYNTNLFIEAMRAGGIREDIRCQYKFSRKEKIDTTKLDVTSIEWIYFLIIEGSMSNTNIAKKFGITPTMVNRIHNKQIWSNITNCIDTWYQQIYEMEKSGEVKINELNEKQLKEFYTYPGYRSYYLMKLQYDTDLDHRMIIQDKRFKTNKINVINELK